MIDMLLQEYCDIVYSISCTTREPRGEEEDGIDYHFLERGRFEELVKENAFIEYALVHGNYYGTLRRPIEEVLAEGNSIVLDIDVQGAAKVRDYVRALPDTDPLKVGYVDIFINPPSMEELRARLEGRGTDSPETIERRLANAEGEMARAGDFFKVDDRGFPYPNGRVFFLQNHEHLREDWYLQKTKPLKIWQKDDPDCEELRFLLDRGLLSLHPETPERYYSAFVWGTQETAPSDAVLAFYHVERDPEGTITGIEFNFIVRDYFEKYYRVLPS